MEDFDEEMDESPDEYYLIGHEAFNMDAFKLANLITKNSDVMGVVIDGQVRVYLPKSEWFVNIDSYRKERSEEQTDLMNVLNRIANSTNGPRLEEIKQMLSITKTE